MRKPLTGKRRSLTSGFTLIELLIAVVIVGVLVAIAYPSFMDSIRKGRRSEAFNALSAIQQAQERWRANNPVYQSDISTAPPGGLGIRATSASGYYTLSLVNVTASGYEAVATAVSGTSQANDSQCASLGVQLAGGVLKYSSSGGGPLTVYTDTDKCWSR